MAIQNFKQINTSDKNLQLIQDNVQQAISALQQSSRIDQPGQPAQASSTITSAFLGGQVLSNVKLSSGQDNLVPHLLNRTPYIWVLAGQDTNAAVWSPVSTQLNASMNGTYINLRTSATCTVSLWVS